MSDEHDLREIPIDSGGDNGERLQESVFTDTMAAMGGVGGVAAVGALYYTRAQYLMARDDYDQEREALRAEYAADRRTLDLEYRALYAQLHGLDALDRLDGFGPEDEYYGGFGVE